MHFRRGNGMCSTMDSMHTHFLHTAILCGGTGVITILGDGARRGITTVGITAVGMHGIIITIGILTITIIISRIMLGVV